MSNRAAVAVAASVPDGAAPPELVVSGVEVVYEKVSLALTGVSLAVRAGQVVALLGSNGAGKTTLLRSLAGTLDIHRGEVVKGSIELNGQHMASLTPADVVERGIVLVPEGRRIFAEFTVEENLRVGAHTRRARRDENLGRVYDLFPVLRERAHMTAGYLSGGEQQMLAIGRGLMAEPRILLLDEPSLGLAPMLVRQIAELISTINAQGTAILLVEQNARMALAIADHGFVLEKGRIVMDGPAHTLRDNEDIKEFYLGLGATEQDVRFDVVKSYRRRKRWLS